MENGLSCLFGYLATPLMLRSLACSAPFDLNIFNHFCPHHSSLLLLNSFLIWGHTQIHSFTHTNKVKAIFKQWFIFC